MSIEQSNGLIKLTADIVASFLSNNTVRSAELPELIAAVHTSLQVAGAPKPIEEAAPESKPAVPIKKSITRDFLISLEDGRRFKSMKRYLAGLGMTPDQYRAKWGLPSSYPMVAPGYAAKRSELAKASGLGNARRKASPATPANDTKDAVGTPAKRRSRSRKAA